MADDERVPDVLERLGALDSCALSDALDRLDLPGATTGISPVSCARRIAGRAITVQLAVAGSAISARHLCTAAVDAGGPGSVIVVEHPGIPAAGWGGILSLAAAVRGIEGVVVDGPARDIDEAVTLGFPVFARSATPVTARGRLVETGWNVPIIVDGCEVAPGDLVLGDRSGVVFVPAGRAAEVTALAASFSAREAEMALAVKRGAAVSEVMASGYERLLDRASQDGDA